MMITGAILMIIGAILMVNNWIGFFRSLVERRSEWRKIKRSIDYLEQNRSLTICKREKFLPLQAYFCKKIGIQGIYGFKLLNHRAPQARLEYRYTSGALQNFRVSQDWKKFKKEFYEEEDLFLKGAERKIGIFGLILTIIGILVSLASSYI
jgi:hypothetical protein